MNFPAVSGAFLLTVALATILPKAKTFAEDTVSRTVATVDKVVITDADVARELAIAFPNRTIDQAAQEAVRRQAIEQLVRRQLVLRYLKESKQLANPAEIDVAVERLKKQLAQREVKFEDYLKSKQLDELGFRAALTWQLSWQRLLEKYFTDANLESYFTKHRREFDGTELHVAHILFKLEKNADAKTRTDTRQQATDVLAQLRAGTITFAEAAKRHSAGPSREAGGDIGWISRHEPMPEPFSRAAFALEVNQISEPVETTFGIHLIRCLEVKVGQKQWMDVRPDLEQAVTEYLFNWAAEQVRPRAKIEILP